MHEHITDTPAECQELIHDFVNASVNVSVGERISQLRRSKRREDGRRWTQQDLADRIGVAKGTIANWETNVQKPRGENLYALARELDCTVEYLLYGEDSQSGAEGTPPTPVSPVSDAQSPEVAQAEEWLRRIANPDMLRRQAGTPTGRDLILGIKSFLFELDWPLEEKNAVDALLNRIAADAEEKS